MLQMSGAIHLFDVVETIRSSQDNSTHVVAMYDLQVAIMQLPR